MVNPRLSYHTPDPTDLDRKGQGIETEQDRGKGAVPPSPPETTLDEKIRPRPSKPSTAKGEREKSDLQMRADELKRKLAREQRRDAEAERQRESKSRHSTKSSSSDAKDVLHPTGPPGSPKPSAQMKRSTPSRHKSKVATVEDSLSSIDARNASPSIHSASGKSQRSAVTEHSMDSDATSIAREQSNTHKPYNSSANGDSSPATETETSEPKTPTLAEPHFSQSRKETPARGFGISRVTSAVVEESPMPPPPPPVPCEMPTPRVDYLVQNGGLQQAVPRSLLDAGSALHSFQTPNDPRPPITHLFFPFDRVLDDYSRVMEKNGSVAVATGYRSVARRLLDRLENVFNRDISSESCTCILCQGSFETQQELDEKRGYSWGEILEYVCGRQELPRWPPFAIDGVGLGIINSDQVTPMQKMDVDVPEEFRDHYVRQSKKTKASVDKWLESQPSNPTSPPQEVDDETLTFAMLTRLEPEQRSILTSILGVLPSRSTSAASNASASSLMPPTSDLLQKTSLAIQRLFRLDVTPRDPESAMFLLTNPSIHNVLATLAAISDGEWEILTSGRFDGFLRSGAEDLPIATAASHTLPHPARRPSRTQSARPPSATNGVTPSLSYAPSPVPSSAGAPVALDEETEIAVLAEVEREIYLGMEALEDAFEALHTKAEAVRRSLRERGAGLSQAVQKRRGSLAGRGLDARMGTPASMTWESETDDGIDDGVSELAPDDSASNVSRSRVRRPRRRTERRTPAPVEEEDEGDGNVMANASAGKTEKGRSVVGKWR